uniref:DUF7894 domain-containing protein n=1 Tax=Lactuca sativa TaxID=4236 RepID=A0A9R1W5N9_LACSA|nr:hypothetical protein LSAT_V11C300136550 [Lactuca sativa]
MNGLGYLYLSKFVRVSEASDALLHLIIDQVSILVLQKYEYTILASAISEVLSSLAAEDKSNMPSLILPFILDTSKTKLERKYSSNECVYGIQIGHYQMSFAKLVKQKMEFKYL